MHTPAPAGAGRPPDRFVDVGGVRVRYWQAGAQGTPVVLVHGIASSVEDWQATFGALSARHRVFAFDLPGCGRSGKPLRYDYSLRALAGCVFGFMDAVGLGQAHLAGFSLGGNLALRCAHAAPGRVRSLILSAPAGVGRDTLLDFRLATLPVVGPLLAWPNAFGLRMLMRKAFFDRQHVTDAKIAERLAFARLPGARSAFLQMLRGYVGLGGFEAGQVRQLQAALAEIAQPALVIWGRQDRLVPVRHAEILAASMPDCHVERIDRCGHLPQAECAERFGVAALTFLAAQDDRAANAPSVAA